jgi:hypothetical protein
MRKEFIGAFISSRSELSSSAELFLKEMYIVTCLLKARIVKQAETAVANERLSKQARC